MQSIIAYNYSGLIGASTNQINTIANTWSGNNINQSKSQQISGSIQEIEKGLKTLLNYTKTLSIANVQSIFEAIQQTEQFKQQNVEILDLRKTEFNNEMNAIITQVQILKNLFVQAQNIYTTINQLQNQALAIQNQRNNIAGLHGGNGCSLNYYKPVCDVLTNIIVILITEAANINQGIQEIASYQSTQTDINNNLITVQPFIEIYQEFLTNEIGGEILQAKATINTFDISNDPNKTEIQK